MRYQVGIKQTMLDQHGHQFHHGIDQHYPFAEGRTPATALRNYRALVTHEPPMSGVWDSKTRQFVDAA